MAGKKEPRWPQNCRRAYLRGDWLRARSAVEAAARRDPRDWRAPAWSAVLLRKEARFGEALAELDRGDALGPNSLWPRAVRSELARDLGDPASAWRQWRALLAADPAARFAEDFAGGGVGVSGREEAWVLVARAQALRRRRDWLEAARQLDAAVRVDGEFAAAWGLLGETLLRAGRREQARRALTEAAVRFEDWPELHLWRGRDLLAGGRPREAAESFARAVDLGLSSAKFPLRRARSLCSRPGSPSSYLRRAAALARRRELDGARRELDAAVQAAYGVGALLARARFLSRCGLPMEAVDDYTRALALERSARLYRARARALFGHRQYGLARRDLDAALALSPDDAGLLSARAELSSSLGEWEAAARDLSAAAAHGRLAGASAARLAQALAFAGRSGQARAALRAAPASRARFVDGVIEALAGRHRRAASFFAKARAAAGRDRARARWAELHELAALARAALPARPARRRGRIVLCGIGVVPPWSLTVEAIRTLSACDVVFKNVSGAGITEFLRTFCPEVRPIVFRFEQDTERTIAILINEAKAGRTAAFLTFGNPLLLGPLGYQMLKSARDFGVDCEVVAAVSSIDAALPAAAARGGGAGGYQVLIAPGAAERADRCDPRLPLLIYLSDYARADWLGAFWKRLRALYPPEHRGFLFDPHHEGWTKPPKAFSLARAEELSGDLLHQGMVLVPPSR